MKPVLGWISVLVLVAAQVEAQEEEPPPDKRQYTLFNPTPDSLLRPLAADRPDATESPITVDAGRIQLELDFFVYSKEREDVAGQDIRVRTFSFMPTNFKVGLRHNMDFQLVVEPLIFERTEVFNPTMSMEGEGFGDITLRLKINLWGNEGGRTAFGIMPFVTLPTNQENLGVDDVEGGLILPYALDLGGGWGLGLMLEFDIVRDSADQNYEVDFVQTAVIGREVLTDVGLFLEIFSSITTESGAPWIGSVNFGLTYTVTENVVLDIGARIGLSTESTDAEIFTGATIRF